MYHYVKGIIASIVGCDVVLERPKHKDLGHFSTPIALMLAKSRKLPVEHIASELCSALQAHEAFAQVTHIKGFINLFLSEATLRHFALLALESNAIPSTYAIPQEHILLEYVSANPTGPLHIGHARGAVLGDSLQRLGCYLGHSIASEYYVNDAGAQIQKLGTSIYLAYVASMKGAQAQAEIDEALLVDCYKGAYITALAHEASAHFGALQIEHIPMLCEFGKERMLEEIRQNLASCGIAFDAYVSEKALLSRFDDVLAQLQRHHGVYQHEGKLWLASMKKGDKQDRVIVRENGEATYLAGDITYHYDKFSRPFSRYINIWGADHHGYIARVRASMEYLGFDSSRLEVIFVQMVSLLYEGKPYKMSKRAGNFILMRDVVEDIGSDAMRFVFLSKKPDTHLEFDVASLRTSDANNPIFYINYANARIHTLLQKSTLSAYHLKQALESSALDDYTEVKELLIEALLLPRIAQMAWEERGLQKICEYAKSLSAHFHAFYNANKILNTHEEALYLCAAQIVSMALAKAMELLGIKLQTSM